MARFVLVHGAFSGGWIWGPLAERLTGFGVRIAQDEIQRARHTRGVAATDRATSNWSRRKVGPAHLLEFACHLRTPVASDGDRA